MLMLMLLIFLVGLLVVKKGTSLVFFRESIALHSVVLFVVELLHEVQWRIAQTNTAEVHCDDMF